MDATVQHGMHYTNMNKQKIIGYGILMLLMLSITFVMATDLLLDEKATITKTSTVCIKEKTNGQTEFTNITEPVTIKQLIDIQKADKTRTRNEKKCYTIEVKY